MSDSTIDRRQFISTGLGLAAALTPAGLRAQGANDRIGIGIIGCGSRGMATRGAMARRRVICS